MTRAFDTAAQSVQPPEHVYGGLVDFLLGEERGASFTDRWLDVPPAAPKQSILDRMWSALIAGNNMIGRAAFWFLRGVVRACTGAPTRRR